MAAPDVTEIEKVLQKTEAEFDQTIIDLKNVSCPEEALQNMIKGLVRLKQVEKMLEEMNIKLKNNSKSVD